MIGSLTMGKRSSAYALLGALVGCAASGVSGVGCEAIGHLAPGPSSTASSTGAGGAAGAGGMAGTGGISIPRSGAGGGPPAVDAGGYCGNQIHQVVTDPPNLYFVFDVSGSMAAPGGGGFTKYELVEQGAVHMIENLGPLINVGAAIFPEGASSADPCHVGAGVFPISPGDPISPTTGPTTSGFIVATSVTPAGGTPTAATLTALRPELLQVPGRTVVILATDGGPNCDAAISCAANQCTNNIEGACNSPGANCCAAGGAIGPAGCIDHDATVAAVTALASAGIPVYVIGVPGSELYASVLDDMAVAGGRPQAGTPQYYDVTDLTGLSQLFGTIAAAFVSCDFTLEKAPPDQGHTNVYFDGTVVPADAVNGWIWIGPNKIELVGAACTKLKTGKVIDVQIVSGCPTQTQN
jgi:hypothetical protein